MCRDSVLMTYSQFTDPFFVKALKPPAAEPSNVLQSLCSSFPRRQTLWHVVQWNRSLLSPRTPCGATQLRGRPRTRCKMHEAKVRTRASSSQTLGLRGRSVSWTHLHSSASGLSSQKASRGSSVPTCTAAKPDQDQHRTSCHQAIPKTSVLPKVVNFKHPGRHQSTSVARGMSGAVSGSYTVQWPPCTRLGLLPVRDVGGELLDLRARGVCQVSMV